MAKDNDSLLREQDLARLHEVKMVRRDKAIKEESRKHTISGSQSYIRNHLIRCYRSKFSEAFRQNRYEKPSEFFLKEMPWIFGLVVYDRYKEAFLSMVDRVRDYPYSGSSSRRSFRSDHYLHYIDRIEHLLFRFSDTFCIDADVADILTGNLPEEVRCYIKHKRIWNDPYVPEMLAYGLDREDPALEDAVTQVINGENGSTQVSWSLVEGIVMSRNSRMHHLLCKLLLAARLQEGLRQVICERADSGTMEAFQAILTTILENNLIRYSSVKRAVGTWIGVISEETRDLDRVSNKSLELIDRCLKDPAFRASCLESEDTMAIHIALWSEAYENAQKGFVLLDRIIQGGTHHQVLTAGYFVANLENTLLRHSAARNVLSTWRDHSDILAVYLPSFIPFARQTAYNMVHFKVDDTKEHYFTDPDQAREFCDWLLEVFGSMKKKELPFSPCIFPWFSASLKKSDLVEKAMIIAFSLRDQVRIDRLCAYIPDCEAGGRSVFLELLTNGPKTNAVRKAILAGLQDKSFETRQAAFQRAKGMELTPEECLELEDMLRLRYDDLRRNAMELLMNQDNADLESTILRLLSSNKTQMRTAGLDMVTQLQKTEDRVPVARNCMEAVRRIPKPTSQEQVLIDALISQTTEESKPEPLFTEDDRYLPDAQIGDYEKSCMEAFMEIFPDSKLKQQILGDKTISHNAMNLPALSCKSGKTAQKNLNSLSEYIVAHERDTYTQFNGREIPIGTQSGDFLIWQDGKQIVPRMDLWNRWMEENRITLPDLFGMMVLNGAQEEKYPYLVRCGKYVRDVFGNGFEQKITCRYPERMDRIIYALIQENVAPEHFQKIATALCLWIVKCLPEDMLLGYSQEKQRDEAATWAEQMMIYSQDTQIRLNTLAGRQIPNPAGHFLFHPQFSAFIFEMDHKPGKDFRHRIPLLLNLYERTYGSTEACIRALGQESPGRTTLLLSQMYRKSWRLQRWVDLDLSMYLYAHHYGLISENTLFYYLLQPGNFKKALTLITSVCIMEPKDGESVSYRAFQHYNSYSIRRKYEDFIGKEQLPREEQVQLVALCHRTADRLLPVILESELRRGDSPAEYSAYIMGIHGLSGAETFVRILRALGKDTLDRSVYYWNNSQSKRGNLSYLLARCAPAAGDTVEKLAHLLKGTDITAKRLVEAALYSPAWIDMIGEYLNLPGFKSACYYFMAHMNEQFDDQKKAIIARFTPLNEDELNLGAFDVSWFRSAFHQLGEEKFDMIYDAAKYISEGSKHTRARKYADAALGRLTVEDTESTVKDKRNKDLLMAYAIIPLAGEEDLIHRYLYLQQFLKESRQFGAQRSTSEKKAVETALRNLATNAGFSDTMRLTLRMETKLVENNRDLFAEKQIGEWNFRLQIDPLGNPEILCSKDGKPLKSIPAKLKKDPYVVRLQDMKKQLTEQYRRTRRMVEEAMEDGVEFTLAEMAQLWENPVVAPIVSKIVFQSGSQMGFFDGGKLVSLEGNTLVADPEAKLTVAHPLHLYRSGNWRSFQQYLFDRKILQPFRQVFRELYVKTRDELGCYTSLRYAGNQIQPKKAAACLKERRWVADIEAGLQKVYYQHNIVATIYAMADWFTPADIEAPTLEYVAFYDRKSGQQLKIDDIPDVIFSEVMRDVDMAVSVAHAGAVDPETSHSTVEMRAAILEFTLPLLRLGNVEIKNNHAFIEGKLSNYSVHLGSGVVHQLGGTMLNVLPVHSQHRGRFFLPFLDEDPKTAEIISKVILFAEDGKLKDPTILCQIKG